MIGIVIPFFEDLFQNGKVRRIGLLTSRGWAQHIVDRWRDAVSNRPSDNPHRGGYHGMRVPGA